MHSHGRLLGHLCQFASFGSQAEVLCTQGLTFLLGHPGVNAVFARLIEDVARVSLPQGLTWRAESRQADAGRPDLEAVTADQVPVVKVEAKLGATFGEGQLESYAADLVKHSGGGVLLVLVPGYARPLAARYVRQRFGVQGNGPWRLPDYSDVIATMIGWRQIVDALREVDFPEFQCNRSQFEAMYRELSGGYIAPITTDAEVLRWRDDPQRWERLVDRVTRHLSVPQGKLLPMGLETTPTEYRRRYVCQADGVEPCYSIGTRDPFGSEKTPIWLRFNSTTRFFAAIRARIDNSDLSRRMVRSSGNLWLPLDVPHDSDEGQMISSLVQQVEHITRVAYAGL